MITRIEDTINGVTVIDGNANGDLYRGNQSISVDLRKNCPVRTSTIAETSAWCLIPIYPTRHVTTRKNETRVPWANSAFLPNIPADMSTAGFIDGAETTCSDFAMNSAGRSLPDSVDSKDSTLADTGVSTNVLLDCFCISNAVKRETRGQNPRTACLERDRFKRARQGAGPN